MYSLPLSSRLMMMVFESSCWQRNAFLGGGLRTPGHMQAKKKTAAFAMARNTFYKSLKSLGV